MSTLFVLAALGLFGYAAYVRYVKTDEAQSVQTRVWLAVSGAGAAVGAAIMSLVSP